MSFARGGELDSLVVQFGVPDSGYDPAAYGEASADFYDQIYGPVAPAVVQTLIALAGSGQVLELGSATGRMAMALHAAGLRDYVGVEASPAMIAAMRAKPACPAMTIVHGDFSGCALPGRFDLIFALVSTFQLLPSARLQAVAFTHLAAHLQPEGVLLLECFDAIEATQRSRLQSATHRILTVTGERDYPVVAFHSTCDTLDAMAQSAGLFCAARWSDWQQRPHAGELRHISLYRLA